MSQLEILLKKIQDSFCWDSLQRDLLELELSDQSVFAASVRKAWDNFQAETLLPESNNFPAYLESFISFVFIELLSIPKQCLAAVPNVTQKELMQNAPTSTDPDENDLVQLNTVYESLMSSPEVNVNFASAKILTNDEARRLLLQYSSDEEEAENDYVFLSGSLSVNSHVASSSPQNNNLEHIHSIPNNLEHIVQPISIDSEHIVQPISIDSEHIVQSVPDDLEHSEQPIPYDLEQAVQSIPRNWTKSVVLNRSEANDILRQALISQSNQSSASDDLNLSGPMAGFIRSTAEEEAQLLRELDQIDQSFNDVIHNRKRSAWPIYGDESDNCHSLEGKRPCISEKPLFEDSPADLITDHSDIECESEIKQEPIACAVLQPSAADDFLYEHLSTVDRNIAAREALLNAESMDEEDENDDDDEEKKQRQRKTLRVDDVFDDDALDDEEEVAHDAEKLPHKSITRYRMPLLSDTDSNDDKCETSAKSGNCSNSTEKKSLNKSGIVSESDKDKNIHSSVIKRRNTTLKKRLILMSSESSDNNENDKGSDKTSKNASDSSDLETHKRIRKIIHDENLSTATQNAEMAEKERRKRITERQNKYNEEVIHEVSQGNDLCPVTKSLILETNPETNEPLVQVSDSVIKLLKPHQVDAVKFLWECVIESVDRHLKVMEQREKEKSSITQHHQGIGGAILAHCMGLGKTLSVIAFIHTLLTHKDILKMRSALVLCPINTILNWKLEWQQWIPCDEEVPVFQLSSNFALKERILLLKQWRDKGGVMIMGYDMFRNLAQCTRVRRKSDKTLLETCLLKPGADLVICDEGHLLKNTEGRLSKIVRQIHTHRRIVLTGTPLQNNLNEYHTMVDFVKPQLLGTLKEFRNRFVNPIINGQHSTSTPRDVRVMKMRAHVLYKTLDGCVQRKDYSALVKFLPPKFEYLVRVRLTNIQVNLYKRYLEIRHTLRSDESTPNSRLFADQQTLYRIWTHPYTLKMHEMNVDRRKMLQDDDSEGSFIDDGSGSSEEESVTSSNSHTSASSKSLKRKLRSHDNDSEPESVIFIPQSADQDQIVWWHQLYEQQFELRPELSGKIVMLFHLLRKCADIGDKVLLFSQSLFSLNIIERFLAEMHSYLNRPPSENAAIASSSVAAAIFDYSCFRSDIGLNSWVKGLDYHRMDGSTAGHIRKGIQDRFNNSDNHRFRLFLISTKAGGLGINLVSANRVVIFDASWNPSHDIQSIFRSYRFGQMKPVYVYRLVARGTMEEKIYDRQITKQSLSRRVVDEQQISRHFTAEDLQALYHFEEDVYDSTTHQPTPILPKDRLLADLLREHPELIAGYHDHDSLLENRADEQLTEEERQEAWKNYEEEKQQGLVMARMHGTASSSNRGAAIDANSRASLEFNRYVPPGMNAMEARDIYNQVAWQVFSLYPNLRENPIEMSQFINQQYHFALIERLKNKPVP